jgi:hypothetical protein
LAIIDPFSPWRRIDDAEEVGAHRIAWELLEVARHDGEEHAMALAEKLGRLRKVYPGTTCS